MHWPPLIIVTILVAGIVASLVSMRLEKPGAPDTSWIEALVPLFMQVLMSIALLGASLYVILSGKYQTPDQHWAYGTIGTVMGFWLKGSMVRKR
jgi:hypothetical protein